MAGEHYRQGFGSEIEVMDFLKDKLTPEQFRGFCLGNMIKYSGRANFKESFIHNIEKARDYAQVLEAFEKEQDEAKKSKILKQVGEALSDHSLRHGLLSDSTIFREGR